ncbi:BspC domain-containing protein [Pararobbsia alpina]|uniref:Uncharacterized protein n=1 Tax=Pararobbsia alpina TaxID=621374 RepID=A0A6S7CC05_9BURK|nr:hypothetical protein [Pararobbsia alpina]CAB3785939.1 hypothetical protein LMG28138_02097 [Pararobbsia alpina]
MPPTRSAFLKRQPTIGSTQLRFPLSTASLFSRCTAGLALLLAASLTSLPAIADQLEQHNDLVSKYINEQHANPIAADCAAHAVFIIGTSPIYDHVDFGDDALTDAHASIEPWDGAFGAGKQKIKVDTMVEIEGLGYRKGGGDKPDALSFRCGYADNKMLAFDSNEPNPGASGSKKRGGRGWAHGKHGSSKSSSHGSSRASKKANH